MPSLLDGLVAVAIVLGSIALVAVIACGIVLLRIARLDAKERARRRPGRRPE
ncbi:MAG: hypothetical protein ACXWN0_10590 [Isosphaeraceae bacterium]